MGEIADMLINEEMFGTRNRGKRLNYRSGIKKYLNSIGMDYQLHYGLLLEFSRDILKEPVTPNNSKDLLSLNASHNFKQFCEWVKEKGGKG